MASDVSAKAQPKSSRTGIDFNPRLLSDRALARRPRGPLHLGDLRRQIVHRLVQVGDLPAQLFGAPLGGPQPREPGSDF